MNWKTNKAGAELVQQRSLLCCMKTQVDLLLVMFSPGSVCWSFYTCEYDFMIYIHRLCCR